MMRTPKDKRVADLVKNVKDFAVKPGYDAVVLASVHDDLHVVTSNNDLEKTVNVLVSSLVSTLDYANDSSIAIQVAALILQSANIAMNDNQVVAMRNTLARLDKEKAEAELPKSNLRLI